MIKMYGFFLLILLILFCIACTKESTIEPPVLPLGSIYGSVIDSLTQLPVINAIVVTTNNHAADTTDSLGYFNLKDLSTGTEILQVTAAGYKPQSKIFVIKPDSQWIDISLKRVQEDYAWSHLGLENKFIQRLRLFKPYLYACTSSDGLWRKNIQIDSSNWEYLGFADLSLGHYRGVGVMDILVNKYNPLEMLLAFEPDDPQGHGIFKSMDGGNSWVVSDSGFGYDINYYSHPEIFCQPPYDLFAAGYLAHSSNFGDTWEIIHKIGSVNDFRYHKKSDNNLWMGGRDLFGGPILYFSEDSGATWDYDILETMVTGDDAIFGIAFDPDNPNVVYASMFKRIIKTTDGGVSWSTIMSYTGPGNIFSILEDDFHSGHLFAVAGLTTLETWDGGKNWIDLESPNGSGILSMLYNADGKALYIGTSSGPEPSNGVFVYKK